MYFIGKPPDINDSWIRHVRAIQRQLLDAGSSTRNLSVLLSVMEKNTNSPSTSPVTVVRIIGISVRAPRIVSAATISGGCLIEEIQYAISVLFWHL